MTLDDKIFKSPPVYFSNDYEDAVMRAESINEIYVKFKGRPEFRAVTSPKMSTIVTDAILEGKEITKEAYEAY